MVYSNPRKYDIPRLDLLTLLLDSKYCDAKEDQVIHCEAADPSACSITKAQARELTKRIAHGLRTNFGVGASGPGRDVVTVISSGQALLPIAFYGVMASGGVYSAASAAATPVELARQIKDGPSNLVICSPDVRDVAISAAQKCGIPSDRVLLLESVPSMSLMPVDGGQSCISDQQLDWDRPIDIETLETRLICLLYSSGTTGLPKGVCLSNMNLVSQCLIPTFVVREYLSNAENAGDSPFEYRTLAHLPTGGVTFWMPKFDFPRFLEYNKKHRISFFFSVPPIYLLIAKSLLVTDQFRSLGWCVSGAAPMGKELQQAASAKLGTGRTFISQTWGLSETTGSVTFMPWGENDSTGSISPLLPNAMMRLVDDEGNDVAPGDVGEMIVQAPFVFKGYHNNPTANRDAFVDGWFKTGDTGHVQDGKIYIVDRKKELIKYKGLQVAPAELEALLISHPDIADAAVIGVDGGGTELPRAYVVADKKKISEAQIQDFVRDNAATHKQLRGGVVFLQAIPKSPSGKILRKDLRILAQKEKSAEGRPKL